MAERPILFSGAMVRAILDGRKTQTRRVVKPQPPDNVADAGVITSSTASLHEGEWHWLDSIDLEWASTVGVAFRCPYGIPGDRLWVRERHHRTTDDGPILFGYDVPGENREFNVPGVGRVREFRCHLDGWGGRSSRNFPSIHMPRWASRITLEITEVRVQRLQDCSADDAFAEGCFATGTIGRHDWRSTVDNYADLWDSINGAGAWDANPWVWALTFQRVSP